MLIIARIIAAASLLWAAVALAVQLVLAWGGGRRDYSARAGNSARGVIYNFTAAMAPAHKETVRLHPVKFLVGVAMHVGTLLALAKVLYVLLRPAAPPVFPVAAGVVWAVALAAALYLFGRRVLTPNLRAMSCLDDYLAVLATAGLIVVAALHEFGVLHSALFLFYAAALLFYLPVGKLRHALFFFIARFDYGRRLGYRGTYPAGRGARG